MTWKRYELEFGKPIILEFCDNEIIISHNITRRRDSKNFTNDL